MRTALAAALLRGVLGTAVAALAVLLLIGLVESLGILADWLPSHLVGSLHALARGDPGGFVPAAAVTLALDALAVAAATWLLGRRDV